MPRINIIGGDADDAGMVDEKGEDDDEEKENDYA